VPAAQKASLKLHQGSRIKKAGATERARLERAVTSEQEKRNGPPNTPKSTELTHR